jgi:hypothetical protein
LSQFPDDFSPAPSPKTAQEVSSKSKQIQEKCALNCEAATWITEAAAAEKAVLFRWWIMPAKTVSL